jgi:Raf kinase inhibitor-like YbhB/YbcL family protein
VVAAALAAAFALTSPAFNGGHAIPRRYTCAGSNVSPALRWQAPPRGTSAFALFVIDRDAGPFTHWTLWDLPATSRSLPMATRWRLQGRNSFGRVGYAGPCPPSGRHRYVFTLYALRRKLGLPRGATTSEFTRALPRNVLSSATVVGTYRR